MSYIQGKPLDETNFPTFALAKNLFGFIPNFYKAQTLRPDLIDAEAGLVGAILFTEGALTRQQKEYIFLVCSAANLSTYCVTAHCEIVRMLGIQGPDPEQVAIEHTATNLPIKTKALLNFALKVNNQPQKLESSDIDALRTYGYSDQHILETVVTIGLAKFANYVAYGLGTLPDFEPVKLPNAAEALST